MNVGCSLKHQFIVIFIIVIIDQYYIIIFNWIFIFISFHCQLNFQHLLNRSAIFYPSQKTIPTTIVFFLKNDVKPISVCMWWLFEFFLPHWNLTKKLTSKYRYSTIYVDKTPTIKFISNGEKKINRDVIMRFWDQSYITFQ